MTDVQISCSLSESDLDKRRSGILKRILNDVTGVEELESGYRYGFPADDAVLENLVEVINFERKCCPFLSFRLIANSGETKFWLELTGPDGTKESIVSLLNLPAASTS